MRAFSPDQLEALWRYHRYRFYEELGWTTMLLFFVVYGVLVYHAFFQRGSPVPTYASLPIAFGAIVYIVYQFFGAILLIVRVHDSGVRHTDDVFSGERIGWFSLWSPVAIAIGLVFLLTTHGLLSWAVFLASGIVASAIARLTLLQGRYRFIETLMNAASKKRVRRLADVMKR